MTTRGWCTIVAVWLWAIVALGAALYGWFGVDGAANMMLGSGIWAALATLIAIYAWVAKP